MIQHFKPGFQHLEDIKVEPRLFEMSSRKFSGTD